jgi:DNA adenine methylase
MVSPLVQTTTAAVPVPFLRWAGSKRKLVPKLVPYWGEGYARYVEPFVGSAALFYAVRPQKALLSDVNAELIESLTAIRDHPLAVHRRATSFPRTAQHYYKLRAIEPKSLAPVDRAARFVYLNRFCFNGLYRTNRFGQFNVPYAPTKTGALPSWEQFSAAARMLRSAQLHCGDFEAVLLDGVRAGDFVYLDPPYAVANRRIFRQYGPQTFGLDDLQRLGRVIEEIDKRRATFVLSYAFCREAKDVFKGWITKRVYTQRNISGFAKHRRTAAELIVTNTQPLQT